VTEPPKENALVALGMVIGCLFGAVGVWVVIIGIPVGIYRGATTGDWTWRIAVAILGVVLWIGFKSGLIRSLND